MKFLLLTLLLSLGASGFAVEAFPEISQEDLAKAIEAKTVTLIDVNGTDSYKQGHIPGAIDYGAKMEELAKLLPSDKAALIVSYCGGPGCGAWKSGAFDARRFGHTNVKHFKGGIDGWKASGAKVETAP